jgi:hypothetical protein
MSITSIGAAAAARIDRRFAEIGALGPNLVDNQGDPGTVWRTGEDIKKTPGYITMESSLFQQFLGVLHVAYKEFAEALT